jgi:hypothetical protein
MHNLTFEKYPCFVLNNSSGSGNNNNNNYRKEQKGPLRRATLAGD